MRTSSAVILMGGLILLVLIGVVVAEDFIMPQDFDEEVSVLSTNNSTNNTTAGTVSVKKHVPPRGIMQKFVVIFWNPWATAPTYNGFVVYKNYIYNRLSNNMWTSVASVDKNNQIVNITASDKSIVDKLNETFNITPNATITMTETPSASITNEGNSTNTNENSTNTNETSTTQNNTEKIGTSINLNDQTLENGTSSTITGTLVDENGTGIADAEVTITINGETTTQTTDSNGQFSYQYTSDSNLDVGEYSMDVSYQGNDTYQESSKSITVTIKASADENPEENTTADEYSSASEKQSSNYNTDNSYRSSSSSSSHRSSSSGSDSSSSSSSGRSSYDSYSNEENYASSESY